MAKISPVSIKYLIYAKFEVEGAVEKPDVIGALFGQTEGLLGADLEMRELQKEGKIGRIEVSLESSNGKTIGSIEVPSALDKTETTLIAAALETIERIGPSNAKIIIEKIEDVRGNKRDYIIERAKKLLEDIEKSVPETREIEENLKISSNLAKLKEYGEEKLPSGNIEGDEVIVVEGRADVINLLKNNVSNVIGMNGTILPKEVKELSYEKEITLFLDGDRGGILIAKNVIDNARIDYIAFAPDGKEVEELSGKEIINSLRKKIPVQDFKKRSLRRAGFDRDEVKKTRKINEEEVKKLFEEITGSKSALLLDENLEVIRKVQAKNIIPILNRIRKKVFAIIIDGIATLPVIKAAEKAQVKNIVAKNFAYVDETNVNLISL